MRDYITTRALDFGILPGVMKREVGGDGSGGSFEKESAGTLVAGAVEGAPDARVVARVWDFTVV